MTQFKLLPKAQTFVCKVRIHNLRKMEIGALLSAFTFNETKGTYHNLGLAKSFGFGCFTCKVELSDDFQFTAEEYVSEFNAEMSCFLQKKDSVLAQDKSLKRLVEIASATHTQEEMAQMDLDGYKQHKSDRDFSVLTETNKEFNVLVDEKEIVVKHLRQNIEQQIKRLEQLPHQEAIDKLSALHLELAGMGLDDLREILQEKIGWHIHKMGEAVLCQMQEFTQLPHQEAIEKLKGLQNDYSNKGIDEVLNQIQQEIGKHNDAITRENQNRRLEAGLSFLLDLKADRPELKLTDFSEGVKRIGQFLKKNTGYTLVPNDDNVLQTWLHTIPVPTKKKDVAEFVSFESNSWKLIRTWVGEDKASQWFETATAR
jgi:hypothetical protein